MMFTGLGGSPAGGHGHPLQYSWLENPMDRGAWRVTVHGIAVGHDWSDLACMHYKYNHRLKPVLEAFHHPGGGGLVTKSCPTLCGPVDCSPPGSSVHGILQARILEWAAISFFRGTSPPRDRTQVSCTAGRFLTNWATREPYHPGDATIFSQSLLPPPAQDNHWSGFCFYQSAFSGHFMQMRSYNM